MAVHNSLLSRYTTCTGIILRQALRQAQEVLRTGLGSTSLTTCGENCGVLPGAIVSEARYLPYGQERWTGGETPTDFGFTSQRNERGFGLYDYKARYYSAVLGRFVSPDSIVPEPGSSGGFNRYRYARGNPLKFTDPSGHAECIDAECEDLVNPHTKELIGNKEWVMSTLSNTPFVADRPAPTLVAGRDDNLDTISAFMDLGAFTASAGGFVGEVMLGTAAALLPPVGDEPLTFSAGYLIGVGIYQPLNVLGDFMGGVGAVTTIANDFRAGDLRYSYQEGPGFVVPSSTQIEVTSAVAGAFIPEAGLDAIIDSHAIGRMEGISIGALEINPQLETHMPTRWIGIHIPSIAPTVSQTEFEEITAGISP